LSSSNANAQAVTDAAILTFALNLEYLDAEFYLRAATGVGLPAQDIGPSPGPVTGGSLVKFKGNAIVQAYAEEIAQEEHKHVQFLRAALIALTGSAISRPALNSQPVSPPPRSLPVLERASAPTRTPTVSSLVPTYSRT
jgi:hypothetical protein